MNDLKRGDEWELALVLGPRPELVSIQKGAVAFDYCGDHFEDLGLGYHNGFYDFLRSRLGGIIGIRYLPWPDAEKALQAVTEGHGITRAKDGKLPLFLIFWGRDRDFDPDAPCDQCFGNNLVYRSKSSGTLAIGFAIDVLTTEERITLDIWKEPKQGGTTLGGQSLDPKG